jgi:hypothetical protein
MIFRLYKNRSISVCQQALNVMIYHRPLSLPWPGSFFYHENDDGYLGHPRNSSPVMRLPEVFNRIHRNPTTKDKVARCKKEKGPLYFRDASKGYLGLLSVAGDSEAS